MMIGSNQKLQLEADIVLWVYLGSGKNPHQPILGLTIRIKQANLSSLREDDMGDVLKKCLPP